MQKEVVLCFESIIETAHYGTIIKLPSHKYSKKDEQKMRETAGEVRKNS